VAVVHLWPPLGEHLQRLRDQFGAIQAAEGHKDCTGKTLQIGGKQASAAVGTEVAIKPLAGFSDIVERLRIAAEEREITFWHTKESRRRATGGLFAVVAMAGRDKSRICVELELYRTTGALCRVFLAHVTHLTLLTTDHSVNAQRLPPHFDIRAELFRLLVQSFDQKLGGRARRGRVLAGNQLAVLDRVNPPVLDLGEDCAEAHQLVLDEEGYHLRQAHAFLLAIGEAGYIPAVDERFVSRGLDMAQHAGGVAD